MESNREGPRERPRWRARSLCPQAARRGVAVTVGRAATSPVPAAETLARLPVAPAAALLGVLLLGLGAARPSTTARVLLALTIVVAGAESAVHSVHHLDNPQGGATCRVLTITKQVHAETSPELPRGVPVAECTSYAIVDVPRGTAQSVRRTDEGRAPPLPLA